MSVHWKFVSRQFRYSKAADSADTVARPVFARCLCLCQAYCKLYCPRFVMFFIARCYASAVFAVIMCPTVRLSVRRLPSTYPPLCCKEIWVSPKIKVLGFGTLSRTSDLENFATASRSRCQQHSSSSSTVELVDDTYTTVDESWLFTTSRSTATL